MSILFEDKTWPELKDEAERGALILIPVGQTEEHGPHLPVNTDTVIAFEIAKASAEAVKGEIPVLVSPPIWASYSAREMSRWPGTIRVRPTTVLALIEDICRSFIEMGFTRLVLVNGHGHNTDILRLSARTVADETNVYMAVVSLWSLASDVARAHRRSEIGGICHACEYETSLMLYLGRRVLMDLATKEDSIRYHSDFFPGDTFGKGSSGVFWSTWGVQESKTGVYGDPTVATREFGEMLARATIEKLAEFLREFYKKRR